MTISSLTANTITSASSEVENLKIDAHETRITNTEKLNNINDLGDNNKDNLMNMTDMLTIEIQKSNALCESKIDHSNKILIDMKDYIAVRIQKSNKSLEIKIETSNKMLTSKIDNLSNSNISPTPSNITSSTQCNVCPQKSVPQNNLQ